jgi:hypothetical protein
VLNAVEAVSEYGKATPLMKARLAAALRALAVRIHGADAIRQDILDIADELERQ